MLNESIESKQKFLLYICCQHYEEKGNPPKPRPQPKPNK